MNTTVKCECGRDVPINPPQINADLQLICDHQAAEIERLKGVDMTDTTRWQHETLDEIERCAAELRLRLPLPPEAENPLETAKLELHEALDWAPAVVSEIERLRTALTEANRRLAEINSTLRGQDFEVLGWHLNGDAEPMDSWFDQNQWEPVETGEVSELQKRLDDADKTIAENFGIDRENAELRAELAELKEANK